MASLSRDSGGTKRVQFYDGSGKRCTLRLGKVPVKDAETFRQRIEELNAARILGSPLSTQLAAWVRDLSDRMHKRLLAHGLVEPRAKAAPITLGELLDRFEATSTVKPQTLAAYRQATSSLREHFGSDKPLRDITPADADDWRKALMEMTPARVWGMGDKSDEAVKPTLARATVIKRVNIAKSIFGRAVKWKLIAESPFVGLRGGSQKNPARSFYVSIDTARKVLNACPDDEWCGIVALTRFAGLRCPSEIRALTWADVNWEKGRLTVRSPKTEAHDGHAMRIVPIVPELRTILLALFDAAPPGAVAVIPRIRDPRVNLRTHMERIITRAGLTPWPRLFQNLRASCETDWVERFPAHVTAAWLGHSPKIAAEHYLHVRDAHFDRAVGSEESGATSGARAAQNATPQESAVFGDQSKESSVTSASTRVKRCLARYCKDANAYLMGAAGFEPA